MRQQLYITEHAIKRFRERIDPGTNDESVVAEMLRCLASAKAKHLRKIHKRTTYIPTDRCIMICSWNKVVTVISLRNSGDGQ